MALVYQCDVCCDRCADIVEQGETQHDTASGLGRGARKVSKQQGWMRVKSEDGTLQDLCPSCAQEKR